MCRPRASRLHLIPFVLLALGLVGCAGGPARLGRDPIPYDSQRHGTARDEWAPHAGVHEWWYLTAVVEAQRSGAFDDDAGEPGGGGPYLVQFTIFHLDVEPGGVFMLHLACSDYESGKHLFEQSVSFDPREAWGDHAAVRFRESGIELASDALRIHGQGRELAMDLTARISGPAVWHGRDGVISMGHPDDPGENSFYYSFVRMEAAGTLGFRGRDGEWSRVPVSGDAWFDRQWGRFEERGWDWFSFRFFDGDRLMLFAFPRSGHREATYARADGSVSWPEEFDYTVERWLQRGANRYGLGWRLELPFKAGRYRVVPLDDGDFNPNLANDYWEGLCRLLDGTGRDVGWCVVETTAPAHTP